MSRKIIFTTLLSYFIFCISNVYAQYSQGGQPYSYTHQLEKPIHHISVESPNIQYLLHEETLPENAHKPLRTGVVLPINKIFFEEATHHTTVDGDVWQLKISSANANAISLYFNKFYLPKKARLFVYNTTKTQLIGAYTHLNNDSTGLFATEPVNNDEVIIEYFQPFGIEDKAFIEISDIGYSYKDLKAIGFKASGSCEVNANCSEGNSYRDQQRAVVRIKMRNSFGEGYCTGTLINNTKQDNTPYLLTASHCMEATTLEHLKQWIFYFNYESSSCTTPSSDQDLISQTLTGAVLKARDPSEGDAGGDFCLLQINDSVPQSYNPYYAGWNRTEGTFQGGVCFHHPSADIKKISTYTKAPVKAAYVTKLTHWKVYWSSTSNGYGVTEEGSSGSALLNNSGEIIGVLTGGRSSCSSQTMPDYYGMFSYSWASNGTTAETQLKPWLDPLNTNVMSLNGMNIASVSEFAKNQNLPKVNIYPNPVSDKITVVFLQDITSPVVLKLYNTMGQEILNQEYSYIKREIPIHLNIIDLQKGLYFLQICTTNGENYVTEKIVKL